MISEDTQDLDNILTLQSDFEDIILETRGQSAADAAELARALIAGLRRRRGGDTIYISTGLGAAERKWRNRAIRAEFNGRNAKELCAKYRLSKTQLYDVLKTKSSTVRFVTKNRT